MHAIHPFSRGRRLFSLLALSLALASCGVRAASETRAEPSPNPGANPSAAPIAPPVVEAKPATTRAMWVTRWNFKTKEDVLAIADACARAGINTIVFQVRGNATAFYRSSLEPWAEQYDYTDPGFDPLETMIQAAHERHMQLKAWVNVVPAWYGPVPPASPDHVYNKQPTWMWYDQKGKRQQLSEKFYVSLNPCLPEVRRYVVDVLRDLVARYPIDGLHLDYIRFPNEPPATPAKSGIDYPRDAKTLALYKKDTGKTPDKDPAAWNRWRTDRVTELLRDIRTMMRTTKPGLELSAAVGARFENALSHFQDAKEWLAQDLVDVVYPMNYTANLEEFQARSAVWLPLAAGGKVVMGMSAEKATVEVNQAQLAHALRAFGGFSIFAYGSLFPSPNDPVDYPEPAARARRDERGRALIPILLELARTSSTSGR